VGLVLRDAAVPAVDGVVAHDPDLLGHLRDEAEVVGYQHQASSPAVKHLSDLSEKFIRLMDAL